MTLPESLYQLILNHMIGLENQDEAQRQSIYVEAEAAKATFECLESVNRAITNSYKEK